MSFDLPLPSTVKINQKRRCTPKIDSGHLGSLVLVVVVDVGVPAVSLLEGMVMIDCRVVPDAG